MTTRTGRCLCGSISFKLTTEPLICRVCWCHDCQHISANGTVNMVVLTEGLSVSGTLGEFTKTADRGNEVVRQFCPGCGCHLFAKSSDRSEFTIVRVGNLDDPSSVQPTLNIWASSAPNWACLNLELDRTEHQPPLPSTQSTDN